MTTFSLNECRMLYNTAAEKESAAKQLLALSETWKDKEALAEGYFGAANMILAKYAFFPFTKLSLFETGKNALEHAIKAAPNVTELRFLRLSIQQSAPHILAYYTNIAEDKAFILRHIENEDKILQLTFQTFCQIYEV